MQDQPLAIGGLSVQDWRAIRGACALHPAIERVILFGSRAKQTYKLGSDVDLALQGAALTYQTPLRLAQDLNQVLALPYYFDVLNHNAITEPALLEHIARVGCEVYRRSP